MRSQGLQLCVCVGLVVAAGTVIGCKVGNAPGPQDDINVTAPGTVVTSDDQGLVVNAPLGIEVRVGDNGVAVKAPGVNVTTGDNGVAVDAPLGVTVRTGSAKQR